MATMITFRIHYATRVGESLFLEQGSGENGSETVEPERIPLRHVGDGYWEGALSAWDACGVLRYRYGFHGLEGTILREPGWRRLEVPAADRVTVVDQWFAPDWADAAFLRQAFAGIIFRPNRVGSAIVNPAGQGRLRITLRAPRVSSGEAICISGAHPLLGGWDPARAVRMAGEGYPVWEVDLPAAAFRDGTEFKFGIWDEALGRLARFEEGPNRWMRAGGTEAGADVLVMNYERFRHAALWRGAGVAIPVFSLRSERGYGVGEFLDLADLAGWAAGCGMHLVQVLPVNDTSSDFTW